MFHLQHVPAALLRPPHGGGSWKRLGSVIGTIAAIGLATGAAFVALLWLDNSMRFLTPAVIRLGDSEPAEVQSPGASPQAAQNSAAKQEQIAPVGVTVDAEPLAATSRP